MKAGGLNVPLMGGDGIKDPKFIKLAGKAADGDLSTSVGAPTDSTEARQEVPRRLQGGGVQGGLRGVRRLRLRRGQRDHQRAEDLARRTPRTSSPHGRRRSMPWARSRFDGVTGKIAFDQYGDSTTKVLTVYKVAR